MHSITRRQTLADLLHRSAARTPNKLAVVCGDTSWTYAEFDRISARVAAGLAGARRRQGHAASRCSRAIRTPLSRCASRWRGSARCWCRSISCSRPRKSPTSCGMPARRMLATDTASAAWRARRARSTPPCGTLIWLPSEDRASPQADMIGFDDARRLRRPRRRRSTSTAPISRRSSTPAARSPRPRARC